MDNNNMHLVVVRPLIIIAVMVILSLALRSTRKPAKTVDGVFWLEYPLMFKAFGLAGLALGSVFLAIVCFVDPKDWIPVLGIATLFGSLGGFLTWETRYNRVGYDEQWIHRESPWRKPRTVGWDDVESAKLSPLSGNWVLTIRNDKPIPVNMYAVGLKHFLDELERRELVVK